MEHNHPPPQHHPHHPGHPESQEGNMEHGGYGGYYPNHDSSYPDPYHPHIHQTFQFTPQQPGPPPRQMSDTEVPPIQFHSMNIMTSHGYGPAHAYPEPHGVQSDPMSPAARHGDVYEPISPHGSDSSASNSNIYHHSRASSASGSASSSRHSLVHRTNRYNPTPSPTSSAGRRRPRSSSNSDDEEEEEIMGQTVIENLAHTRKEATRKQRIEAEQRRRDDLRDGYAKLKDALPISNQKNSKVSLLERACNHIRTLEDDMSELREKVASMEKELVRLRAINEAISLGAQGVSTPVALSEGASVEMRSTTPTSDVKHEQTPTPGEDEGMNGPQHSLTVVKGQQPPREDSPMSDRD